MWPMKPGFRRRAQTAASVLAAALAVAGCSIETKEGSGNEASETREVESFTAVSLSGGFDVVVSVGGAQEVTVRGDDNLLEDVESGVDDGTLELSQPDNVDLEPKTGLTVEITIPELESVDLSGAGDVNIEGLNGEEFRVDVSGAGDVEATGEVDRVEADVSGAGALRLSKLVAREASVDLSGAGDIHVHATESLTASLSGAGNIVYSGDPADVDTDVSGVGQINPE